MKIPLLLISVSLCLLFLLGQAHKTITNQTQLTQIFFVPGLKMQGSDYATTIKALTDKGYNVTVLQPKDQDPTNYQRIVDHWTSDLEKKVGNQQVIVIGHSIGGATAIHYCEAHTNCLKAVNMDGIPAYEEKKKKPTLYIQAGIGRYCDDQCKQGRDNMEKMAKRLRFKVVKLPEIKHMNFTDKRTLDLYAEDYLSLKDGRKEIQTNLISFINK